MKQKLKNTFNIPHSPNISSQLTTQTSSFFPLKPSISSNNFYVPTKKPSTASSNEISLKKYMSTIDEKPPELSNISLHKRFKTVIQEQTNVKSKNTRNPLYFSMDINNNIDNNIEKSPHIKKKSIKKLTFMEDNCSINHKTNTLYIDITKAKELSTSGDLIPRKNLSKPQEIARNDRKCNTGVGFHKGYNIENKSKIRKINRKYDVHSEFLKNIVKINKPKFEVKIDFLKKQDFHQNYKNFLFSQSVLLFIKNQCKTGVNEETFNLTHFLELSKDTYTYILQLFPLVRQAITSIRNRQELDKTFHDIGVKCQQSRNMALTLKSLLLHAKIIYMLQDVYKAIIIYKNCKKMAISFFMHRCLISCYKGLGRCFQYMKQYGLALMYYSKMLQCAWKIKDADHEILAYDMIGMQYYYMGDLEKSKYYHQRMVDGELEPDDSNVKRLAIANFLIKKNKNAKDLNKIQENPLNQFTDNLLDSSDDGFELPNPSNRVRNASEPDLKKHMISYKHNSKNHRVHIPGKDLLSMMEKTRKERMIGTMRTTDEFKRSLQRNITLGRINKNPINALNQEKVLVSHLSPNRDLQMYQLWKPTGIRNINFYNINDYLYENDEYVLVNKIKEKLKGYAEKLLLTMNKLKAIFVKGEKN